MKKSKQMKNKWLTLICLLLIQSQSFIYSQTQQQKVSGIVMDEMGTPVVGATVQLKGKPSGTLSDTDGRFELSAPWNEVLIISYVGYKTEEVPIGGKTFLQITLKDDVNLIDELLVVGYGSVRRGDLTGAVGSVNMESMLKAPVASFDYALAGRVAGVEVNTNDGQPGAGSNIVIRGAGSLTQNVSPIFVIDGFILEDFDPSSLSPQDIESINILKDASSTAIYGARGANGVIIINTKMGKIGKPTISYSGSLGVNNATKRMKLMNSYEFIKLQIERFPDQARSVYYSDIPFDAPMDPEVYRNAPAIDWQDKVLRSGFTQIHNLSLSGGNASTKYMTSLSYYGQNGTLINTGYDRIQGRMVLDQSINSRISMVLSTLYSHDKSFGIVPTDASLSYAHSSFFYSVYGYRPLAGLTDEANWDLEHQLIDDDPNINGASDYRLNPVIMAENEYKTTVNNLFIPSLSFNIKLSDQLSLTLRGGMDQRMREYSYFYNSKTRIGIQRPGVTYAGVQGGVSFYQYRLLSNENILTYKSNFSKNHKIDASIGVGMQKIDSELQTSQYQEIPYEELGISGMDLGIPMPGVSRIGGSTSASIFGRLQYSLYSRYLFTATLRRDGSSKFTRKNRWGYFPSGAFAWRLSGEPFMRDIDWSNDIKFRASFGITGNNRIGDFDRFAKLETPYSVYYSFNNETPERGADRVSLGNIDLKWETTEQTNIGADISLFKNRFNLVMDLYRKKTKDLLLNANLTTVSGFSTAMKNVGSLQNEGLEITLSTINLKTQKFSWLTDFNISFYRNEVLALNGEEPVMYSTVIWDSQFTGTPLYRTEVGGPISEFWGVKWEGIYQISDFTWQYDSDESIPHAERNYLLKDGITSNGKAREKVQPGDIKYVDQDGDLNITSDDRVSLGSPYPKHTGGFNNTFKYNNWTLNVFFQWSYGNQVFNANRIMFEGGYNVRPLQNQYASYENRWTYENQNNKMFRAGLGGSESGAGPNGVYSDYTLEDGSFLRLKTVSLDYQLPSAWVKKVNLKTISVGVAAQNIYTWTNYSGLDPEVSTRHTILTPAFDYSSYPRAFSAVFNLKLTL